MVAPTDAAVHNLFTELDRELLAKTFNHVVETDTRSALMAQSTRPLSVAVLGAEHPQFSRDLTC